MLVWTNLSMKLSGEGRLSRYGPFLILPICFSKRFTTEIFRPVTLNHNVVWCVCMHMQAHSSLLWPLLAATITWVLRLSHFLRGVCLVGVLWPSPFSSHLATGLSWLEGCLCSCHFVPCQLTQLEPACLVSAVHSLWARAGCTIFLLMMIFKTTDTKLIHVTPIHV